MINGINSREMILEILLEIEEGERENTAISLSAMLFPNISSFQDRRELLLPESVKEHWNIVF